MPPPSPTTTQTHNTTQVSRSECDNNDHEDVGNRSNNKHTTGDSSSGGHSGGLLPDEALQCYGHLLTTGECNELAKMGVVYYFGQASAARQRRSASTAPSQGLQDDGQAHVQLPQSTMRKPSVDALLIPHEHIAFRYEIVKVLGSGAFGHVVHAIDHATGDHVAIKLMPMSRKILSMARQEVRMLQLVSAKDSEQRYGIVHMRDTFSFRGHVCIVFDLLGINLYDVMRLRKFEPMPLRLVRRIAAQLLVSLAFLWREGIVHADIKPENVVLQRSDSSVVKLIDLGTAAVDTSCVLTYAQSRFYRAPEVILGLPCGRPMDMWSFGCVLCELATGTPLFAGVDEYDQLHCIMEYLGAPPQALAAVCRRRHDFFDDALQPRPCCAAHASAADGEKDEDDVGHTGKTSQRIQQQHHNNKAAAADADAAATIDDDDSNNNSDADGDAGGGGGGTVAHAALCNAKPHPRRVPASRTLHKMLGLSHDDAFVDFVMLFLRWDPQQRAPPRVAMRHAWVCEEFVAQAAPEAATATPAAAATQAATQAATTSSDSNNNAPPRPSTTRTAAAAADAATTEAAAAAAAATASDANKDSIAATAAASAPLPPMMASSPLHKSTTSSEAATSPHTTVVVDVTSTAPAAPPPAVPTSPARPPPPSKSFAALTHTQDNIVANTDASAAIAAAAAYASLQSSSSSSLSTTATTATTASSLSQTHDTKQASNTIVSAYEVRPPSPLLSVPPVASAAPTTTTTLVVPATQARQQRCASATVAQPQAAAVAAATRQQPQHKRTISISSPSSTTDVAAAAAAPASPPSCFFFAPVERAPPPSTAPVVRALPSTSSSSSSAAAMAQSQTHTKQSSTMTPTTTTTAVTSAAPTSRVSPLPLPSQPSQPSPLSSSPTHMHMSLPTAQQQLQQQHTVVAASHDDVAPASRVAHTSPLHSHKGDDNDKGTCADNNNKTTRTAATLTTAAHNKPAASSLTSNNGNRTAVNSTDTSTAVNDKSATFTSGVAAVTVRRTNKTFAANKMGAAAAAAASRTELHAKPKTTTTTTTTTTTSSSNSSSNNSNNSNNSSNDTYGRVDKQRTVGGGDSQRSGEAECNDTEARVRVGDGIDKNAKASTLADKGNNNSNNNKNNNDSSSSSTVPPSTQVAKVGDGKAAPQPQATAALYTALTTPHAGAVVPRRRTVRPLPSSVLTQAAAATSARAASIAITPTTAAFATAAVAVTSPSHSTIMSVADSKATQLLSSSIGNSDSRSSGSAAAAGYKRNSDTCGVGYAARTTAWPASLPPLRRLSEGGEAMAQARLLRR